MSQPERLTIALLKTRTEPGSNEYWVPVDNKYAYHEATVRLIDDMGYPPDTDGWNEPPDFRGWYDDVSIAGIIQDMTEAGYMLVFVGN